MFATGTVQNRRRNVLRYACVLSDSGQVVTGHVTFESALFPVRMRPYILLTNTRYVTRRGDDNSVVHMKEVTLPYVQLG